MSDLQPGTLYVVATPIGNLEDITWRAVRILRSVDLIAAEDTRHTGKLLAHLQINTPQISYHDHNQQQRQQFLLQQLHQGKTIALVSDAGMPGICDPGFALIQACIRETIGVIPIPGCSAVTAALGASGLPADQFVFWGFLPAKGGERQRLLVAIAQETKTSILYEAPHRLQATLQDLANASEPTRSLVLAREMTKVHEEFWRGDLASAIALYTTKEPKGEYTLILGRSDRLQIISPAALKAELLALISSGVSRSQASRQLAQATNLPRQQIYQMSLEIDLENRD